MPDSSLNVNSNSVPTLSGLIQHFLTDLENASHSVHTLRAYTADLSQLSAFCKNDRAALDPNTLRAFFASLAHLSQSSRARKQASVASFLTWAYRQDLIDDNPMLRIERVRLEPLLPRSLPTEQVKTILAVIPSHQKRDRLLFWLLAETGLRISEALHLHVEDVDLTIDSERLLIHGKGGRQRLILLDDPHVLRQLKAYLTFTSYRHGPLFRAQKNGCRATLSYQAVQKRWATYCTKAGIKCSLHQLRHSHATALINGGVSITTIRKRLGTSGDVLTATPGSSRGRYAAAATFRQEHTKIVLRPA